jgi:hypothetical protein
MNDLTSHLSEHDLQEAAESAAWLPAARAAHLQSCALCQGRVATYQQLFAAAAHLPQPAFSFDLAASILAQLPPPKPSFPWAVVLASTLVLGAISMLLFFFGGLLLPIVQSLSTELGLGMAAIAGFFVVGQGLELLAQHRRQLSLLTLS